MDESTKFTSHMSWTMTFCVKKTTSLHSDVMHEIYNMCNWISKNEIDHKGKTNVHMDEIFSINEINHTSKLHSKWHWYKNEP
jgi:hypothetical protein